MNGSTDSAAAAGPASAAEMIAGSLAAYARGPVVGARFRPLVLGRLERGWVVASETAALDIVGASVVREVEPGELLAIDEHGVRSQRFAVSFGRWAQGVSAWGFSLVHKRPPDAVADAVREKFGTTSLSRGSGLRHRPGTDQTRGRSPAGNVSTIPSSRQTQSP